MAFGRKETVRLPPLFGGSLAAIGMNQGSPPIQEPPLLAVGITLGRGIMRIHGFVEGNDGFLVPLIRSGARGERHPEQDKRQHGAQYNYGSSEFSHGYNPPGLDWLDGLMWPDGLNCTARDGWKPP